MNGPMKEWDALSADWREQSVPAIDVDALRAEATRQGRRLRVVLVLETAFAVLVIAMLAWLARRDPSPVHAWLFGGLAAFLVPYQAYMLWLRRREWREAGLDAAALVEVELRRCDTTEHYWRVGMWGALAIWGVVYGLMMAGLLAGWPRGEVAGLVGATLGNIIVLPLMGLYGLWRCRDARARRRRLLGLRRQLGGLE
ncbi:hypothetical protein K3217_29430 [bacterium BD-1]|nr:hypothetical protein [Ottowia caeni]